MTSKPKIVIVSRELKGMANAGGVKDVTFGLAKALLAKGIDSQIFLPLYGFLGKSRRGEKIWEGTSPLGSFSVYHRLYQGMKLFFIAHPVFDKKGVYTYQEGESGTRGEGYQDAPEMNGIFTHGVLSFLISRGAAPALIHGQDSHTGFLALLAREFPGYQDFFKETAFVTTLHNAGPGYHFYVPHHKWNSSFDPANILKEPFDKVEGEGFRAAAIYGNLHTVSPDYASEIMGKGTRFSSGLGEYLSQHGLDLKGFYNGMPELGDTQKRSIGSIYPFFRTESHYKRHKKILLRQYLRHRLLGQMSLECPLISFQGRLVHQKGVDLLLRAIREFRLLGGKACFLVQGQGQPELENELKEAEKEGLLVYISDFDSTLGELLYKASDFFVIPSRFEPCGLTDIKALISGTLPLVHLVGGLKKIRDGENGFGYPTIGCPDLTTLLFRAQKFYHKFPLELQVLKQRGMRECFQQYPWDMRLKDDYLPYYKSQYLSQTGVDKNFLDI